MQYPIYHAIYHIYYSHLISARFRHCTCHESPMITQRKTFSNVDPC